MAHSMAFFISFLLMSIKMLDDIHIKFILTKKESERMIQIKITKHDLKPLCPICESLSLSDFFKISPVICVIKRKNRGK